MQPTTWQAVVYGFAGTVGATGLYMIATAPVSTVGYGFLLVGLMCFLIVAMQQEVRARKRPGINLVGNTASEALFELVHIRVTAPPGIEFQNARARMEVNDETFNLMWVTDQGPQETRNLRADLENSVLLVARSRVVGGFNPWGAIRGESARIRIAADITYITDRRFLAHQHTDDQLPIGRYPVSLTLTWDGGRKTYQFDILVAPSPDPIELLMPGALFR